MIIQERDLKVLKYIFENRVTTLEQIRKLAFTDRRKTVFYRRILKLADEGYIVRTPVIAENNRSYWNCSPNEKGLRPVSDSWPFEIDKPLFKSESPAHDIRLGDIRFKLEMLERFESFYPENLLQSSKELANHYLYEDLIGQQPDGALNLLLPNGGSRLFALEFELNKKAPERYQKKLSGYYKTDGIDGVIYICSKQDLIDRIAKVDSDIRGRDRSILYFALEQDVLSNSEKITFHHQQDPSRSLILRVRNDVQEGAFCLPTVPRGCEP